MNPAFSLPSYLAERRQLVDAALRRYLPPATSWPPRLHEAMHYSLAAGGKRLRPILVMASAEAVGKSGEAVLPVACALELIHTYSLIHDDLPAMDDDDLRRGQPTNHKVFGEAMAILAGDALLTEAFRLIAASVELAPAPTLLSVVAKIAEASGCQGMVAGQAFDLMSEEKTLSPEELERLHRHKTGKLIAVSVESGALLAGASPEQQQALSRFGTHVGLAFQIADDILDIEGGTELGKDIGSDMANQKSTYPALLGLQRSKELARQWTEQALRQLENFDAKADPLREIAAYIVYRKH